MPKTGLETDTNDLYKSDWWRDINSMHRHYGFHDIVHNFSPDMMKKLLEFRVNFLAEELFELKDNIDDPEEVVDACIDLIVVAIGHTRSLRRRHRQGLGRGSQG